MPTTMRAAIARTFKAPLTIEEIAIPEPGPGEVLVKIVASGVCHTDLHAIDGDWPVKPTLPLIPGHEGVGHVVGLGAGVTVYKGLKETEAKPGEWVTISGVGGLGHVAVQYAKAMGLHVVALDIGESKLELARSLGADLALDARADNVVAEVQNATGGGAHGVLVTAVSPPAFAQAIACTRRRATVSLVGLPPGDFPTPIFDVVLKRVTVRGSIVGTRRDLAEAIAFAVEGKVKAHVTPRPFDDVNAVLDELRAGKVDGRISLTL